MSGAGERLKRLALDGRQPAMMLVAWIYLYVVGLLLAWVVLVALITSWQPIVIVTESMQPNLSPGDVLLVKQHPDLAVPQRSVITFRSAADPETLITHRVFAVEGDGYLTKGDANQSPDIDRVPIDAVEGVGRVIVPLVGLPVVWARNGDGAALLAWLVVSLAAAGYVTSRLGVVRRRFGASGTSDASGPTRRALGDQQASPVAERAIRRVRILIGVIVVTQYFIDASRFDIEGVAIQRWQLLVGSLLTLTALNLASIHGSRSAKPGLAARLSLAQLVCDTLLVLALTMGTGTDGIGWVLFALPIVEAAARYRLAGALIHWTLLTGLTLTSRIWMVELTEPGSPLLIDELEQVLDQLSVLLLVVIPGAHLAEQLVGDVMRQRQATAEAEERGRILERVAETGHELNRLGGDLFTTVTAAAIDHGFDSSDVCLRVGVGPWRVVERHGEPGLPGPAVPGGGLRPEDDSMAELLIDADDPDPDQWAALESAGFATLVRVIVSRRDSVSVAVRAGTTAAPLKRGAIDAFRLMCGQTGVALQNEHLLDELRQVHDALAHQATHDPLTGLPNRARFMERLKRAVETRRKAGPEQSDSERSDSVLAVLFLDLDGFKAVNDKLGHDVGDGLLVAVASRLIGVVGEEAIAARLGGDEFTVLLDGLDDRETAEDIVVGIGAALAEPFRIGAEFVAVGTSIGLAYDEDGIGSGELLRRADAAMYDAKSRGSAPSTATFHRSTYHPDLDAAEDRRTELKQDFRKALDGDELQMQYQPIMTAADGQIIGAEALLRWNHPTQSWIDPATIFAAAEANGMVDSLTRWILERSTTEAALWGGRKGSGVFVSVNVSSQQLQSAALESQLSTALILSGLQPADLVLELSEDLISGDPDLLARLDGLAGLGVGMALDNFGGGSSSLPHLNGLPMTALKLARVLVNQSTRSTVDRVVLDSMCRLAAELGLDVVAEGVETEDELRIVQGAGARWVQGFFFHRAMSSLEFNRLLENQRGRTDRSLGPGERAD